MQRLTIVLFRIVTPMEGSSVQINKNAKKDFKKAWRKDAAFRESMRNLEKQYDKLNKQIEIQKGDNSHPTLTEGGTVKGLPGNSGQEGNTKKDFLIYSEVGNLNYKIFRVQYFERFEGGLIPDANEKNKLNLNGQLSTTFKEKNFAYWSLDPYKELTQRSTPTGFDGTLLESLSDNTSRTGARVLIKGFSTKGDDFSMVTTVQVFAMSQFIYVKVPKGIFGYKWSQQAGVKQEKVDQSRLQTGTILREYFSRSNDYDKVFISN
jgi:hypothetical protein